MHVESIPWITKGCYFHLFHHLSFYNLRFLGQELALFIHLENLWNTESMWMEWRESICLSHKFHGNKFLQKCSICSKWLANVSENSGLQWCLCSFYELSPPLLPPQALSIFTTVGNSWEFCTGIKTRFGPKQHLGSGWERSSWDT